MYSQHYGENVTCGTMKIATNNHQLKVLPHFFLVARGCRPAIICMYHVYARNASPAAAHVHIQSCAIRVHVQSCAIRIRDRPCAQSNQS